jgi:hypothetical protein
VVMCLDQDFLTIRIAKTLWNIVADLSKSMSIDGKVAHLSGDLFEDYCNRLLTAAVRAAPAGTAWMASRQELEKAALDGLYVQDKVAVAFEFKSAPLPLKPLFATEPSSLGAAIKEAVIIGKKKPNGKDDRRGFIQCRNHLRTMLNNKSVYHLDGVTKIIPCVVTVEDALTWSPCYTYATREAKSLFTEFGELVSNPVLIHVEDLGLIAARSRIRPLPKIILDLSAGLSAADACTRNMIHRIVTDSKLQSSGQKIEIERPTDFLDRAIKYLESHPLSEETPCPMCDPAELPSALKLIPGKDGRLVFWCSRCEQEFPATDEQISAHLDEKAACEAWYRAQSV